MKPVFPQKFIRTGLFLWFFLLLWSNITLAQLCQGGLGEPIVNVNFGAGSNPGSPLAAATTNYQFVPNDCPGDGFYTVRNRSDNCFGGWHTLLADHSGNANGYFMLVNASNQPSAFYIDTVDLACSNTVFEFAAWVVNMNRPSECGGNPNRPNLTFNIEKTDGTVLQSYNSGDIPAQTSLTWKQYGFFFSLPSSVNKIVLRITNNAPGGCGNDLAMDDITFRPCGPQLNTTINGNSSNVKNICTGETTIVSFNTSVTGNYASPVYQWQMSTNSGITWADLPGANQQNLSYSFLPGTPAGNYLFRLTVTQAENAGVTACRVNSPILTIIVNNPPDGTATNSGPICEGLDATFTASGGIQYSWTGVNGFAANGSTAKLTNVQMTDAGQYFVNITNAAGCIKTYSTDLVVKPSAIATTQASKENICAGDTVQLSGGGGTYFNWQPAVFVDNSSGSATNAFPTDTTIFQLIVNNIHGCADTGFVTINVSARPVANAGADKFLIQGQSVKLNGSVQGSGINYAWYPAQFIDNVNILEPVVKPPGNFTYYLQAVSFLGCGQSLDSVLVKVYNGVYVPTAFSPNDDKKNDRWFIPGLAVYADYEILVFNRYGQVIFQSKDAAVGWDGKYKGHAVPVGTYVYLVKIHSINQQLKGLLTIIR